MYEMYPDVWAVAANRQPSAGDKPRRRARKEHSVLPAVIAHLGQSGADVPRSGQAGR